MTCFESSEGHSFVHIMDQCYSIVPIAHGIQKNSIIKKSLSLKIRQLREGGLIDKYISDASDDLGMKGRVQFKRKEARKTVALTLSKCMATHSHECNQIFNDLLGEIEGPVIVILFLFGIALIIFVMEYCFNFDSQLYVELLQKYHPKK